MTTSKRCLCTQEMYCRECNPTLWDEYEANRRKFYAQLEKQPTHYVITEPGQYFQHGDLPHMIARVDQVNTERGSTFIQFSIKDRNNPSLGWTEGAALEPWAFHETYPTRLEAEKVAGPARIRLVATHDMVMPDNLDFVSSGAAEALLKAAMAVNEVKYRWEEIRE